MKYEGYVHFLATSPTPMISHQTPVKQPTSVPTSSTPWITSAATVIYPAANRSLSPSYDTISQGLGEQSNTALTVNNLSTTHVQPADTTNMQSYHCGAHGCNFITVNMDTDTLIPIMCARSYDHIHERRLHPRRFSCGYKNCTYTTPAMKPQLALGVNALNQHTLLHVD